MMNLIQVSMRISGLVDALDEITETVKSLEAADGNAAVTLLLMDARREAAKLARASHVLALEGMQTARS